MTQITVTYRDGRMATLENVYIRGSKIRFLILPDMLKNAPMFKKQGTKAGTAGRGKSAILRAQGMIIINCKFEYCLTVKFLKSFLAARGRGRGGPGQAGPSKGGQGKWQQGGPSAGRGRGGI